MLFLKGVNFFKKKIMHKIRYIDRSTHKLETEKVYGEKAVLLLYGNRLFSKPLLFIVTKFPLFSKFYGWMQKRKSSKKKIKPFIQRFGIDEREFENADFTSFNDFFIRKLKKSARPIDVRPEAVVAPADGRYLVYPNIEKADGFYVKGKKFTLQRFLKDDALADRYKEGGMVIARLCPVDYHRFHFPVDCKVKEARFINGMLHSVNPIALCKNIECLSENKRFVTELETKAFRTVLFIEIGAVNVGSVHQTHLPNTEQSKGAEKGFFSFGGSCIVMLFEPNTICFDQDLVEASHKKIETLVKMGSSIALANC